MREIQLRLVGLLFHCAALGNCLLSGLIPQKKISAGVSFRQSEATIAFPKLISKSYAELIKLLVILVFVATGCVAQITFVQGGKTGYRESSQVACPAETNTSNHLLLAAIYSTSNSVALSVSDAMGNTWTALPTDSSSYGQVRTFYAIAKATGANTISANQTSNTAIVGLFCSEWSGNATSNVLDAQTAANASSSTASMSSGNLTTTGTSDLLYCVFADKNEGVITIGSGFTQDEIDTGFGALSEYKRNLTAGGYSCNASDTGASGAWLAYAAAFKAAASSATLQSITVAPATPSVPVAGTQQLTATGHYSDGSTNNVTDTATWSANGTTVSGGSFAFVQGGKTGYRESSQVACPAETNTSNHLLLAAIYSTSNSVALSVSDAMGNTWTALPTDSSSYGQVRTFYAIAKATGANTISANQTSNTAIVGLFCSEWSGNATSNVLDAQTAANASSSTASMSSGNLTTTGTSDLLYCVFADKNEGVITIGSGFTQDEIDTGFGALSEYKRNLTAGGYSCNASDTGASGAWLAYAAAFKAGGVSTAVASVNSTGLATGLDAGTSTITATLTGISGSVTLTVTSGGVSNPVPTVTAISPNSGTIAGGTAVTIVGTGFLTGATVTLGGTAAINVTLVNSTSITATTPAEAAGVVNVVVTDSNGSGTLANGFTYSNSAPTVTAIAPTLGTTSGGTLVTLTGTNFVSGMIVTFGGVEATETTVVNSTSITATTPAHAAGAVSVVATNLNAQSGTLTNGFTYAVGVAPINFVQVAAATPQEPESSVTVPYSLSQTAGDLNIVVVGWNDTVATVQSVTDSLGNSYFLAIGPIKGAALQQSIYYAKDILGGSNEVKVVFSPAAAFPDIRILEYSGLDLSSPLDGKSQSNGSSSTASTTAVNTTAATELIFAADTVFTGNKAAGAGFTRRIITTPDSNLAEDGMVNTTGSYGASATLTTSGPWVMQMATFEAATGVISLPPTITSAFPGSGSTSGGTVVTITGINFGAGAGVTFDGVASADVVVVSNTMINAVAPAGSAGSVTIVLTEPNVASASLTNGFTYVANEDLASGPLKVSPTNPRYFANGTGQAVYLTGAHTWQDNVDGWGIPNDCPVPPAFDWPSYLAYVQGHQYNWIRLWTWDLPASASEAVLSVNIATLSRVSNVVTATTAVANPFVAGNLISIGTGNALSNPSFAGRFVISTVSGSQFTFQQVAANASATGGTVAMVQAECHLPVPYQRTGSSDATDGLPKFDLTQFDQSYFDRLRQRVIDAGQLGIYVSVMLFDGHGVQYDRLATDGYRFSGTNNINAIDDGYVSGSASGVNSTTLSIPTITAFQDAYVKKVIDSVNDLDNVMYEVANEADGAVATPWESHVIDVIHQYEAGLPKQHPVGFTCEFALSPTGDSTYFTSNADWVAPCGSGYGGVPATEAPGTATSTGVKVVMDDTDHSWYYTEIQLATTADPNAMRKWAWENFTRGANTAFMDPYLVTYPGRNAPSGTTLDPYWNVMRTALTQTAAYARRIDLGEVVPSTTTCSTTYCLVSEKQYLIYSPTGGAITVQLAADTYSVEWFNPATNAVVQPGPITVTGGATTLTPPFSGPDAVLLLLGN